ncbi:MAG: signal peptidase I, partial [Actinomycetota bacterium]|nr:signal peptidase I [Actinomycetota bacterium]
ASARTPRPWWQRVLHASAALVVVGVAAGFALVSRANHAYITTPSMYPTIPPGAMVFISPRRSYHVGEVIEFHANGLLWVHRLIAIRPNGDFVTKGDNPQSTPDVFSPPTTGRDVVGVVTRTVPYLGFPQLFVNHPAYALGWLRAELGTRGRVAALVAAAGLALFVALGGRTSDRSGTRRRRAHAARAR